MCSVNAHYTIILTVCFPIKSAVSDNEFTRIIELPIPRRTAPPKICIGVLLALINHIQTRAAIIRNEPSA